MNGRAISMVMKMAMIFGTKTSVCSWIWVSAWNSAKRMPTTRPTAIIGAATRIITQMPSRAMSRTWAPFMSGPLLDRHAHDFLVRVDHLVAYRHHAFHRELGLAD